MCQECIQLEEQMRKEDKAQALLEMEDMPQTIDQIIFWLEIGGYAVGHLQPGFVRRLVRFPYGHVESLSVEDMRSRAIWVWWQYKLT